MRSNWGPPGGAYQKAQPYQPGGSGPSYWAGRPSGEGVCGGPECGIDVPPCAGEAPRRQPTFNKVAQGQGQYIQEQTYQYAGTGQGDYMMPLTPQRTSSRCCICCGSGFLGLLALAGIVGGLFWYFAPPSPSSTTTTVAPYDCDVSFDSWEQTWSLQKKAYCCHRENRGCPTTPRPKPKPKPAAPARAPPAHAPVAFDCTAGFANWQKGWSKPKQRWCCHSVGKGCPHIFDCDAAWANWRHGWSEHKKTWCCEHGGKGCPDSTPTTTSSAYDCEAGFANFEKGWSLEKKAWCCQHTGKGCPTPKPKPPPPPPPPPPQFDCAAGFGNWQAGWSVAKKAWCCSHGGKGCAPDAGGCGTPAPVPGEDDQCDLATPCVGCVGAGCQTCREEAEVKCCIGTVSTPTAVQRCCSLATNSQAIPECNAQPGAAQPPAARAAPAAPAAAQPLATEDPCNVDVACAGQVAPCPEVANVKCCLGGESTPLARQRCCETASAQIKADPVCTGR